MRKTEWRGRQCPPEYEVGQNGGQRQLTLYVDARQEVSDDGAVEWVATALMLPVGVSDYGSVVSAIIASRYDADAMQAVMNNHLLGDGDKGHEAEFRAMQEWRKEAKRIAREAVEGMGG